MNLEKIKTAYFIGIGGIGMSALARHFNSRGVKVSGYDRTSTFLTKELEKEGMKINYIDTIENIPENIELVVYTPAIPKDHKQLNFFLSKNYVLKKRSEILEELTRDKFTIAIGGSHGKTSVTTLIAHILKHSDYDCTAFLGGISVNYNSNYIAGKNDVVVVEADEFDRSFLRLTPNIAVITAVDTDHLDIYGSRENIEIAFLEFTEKIKPGGTLVAQASVPILKKTRVKNIKTYSFHKTHSDHFVTETSSKDGATEFNIGGEEDLRGIKIQTGGKYNIENALAAYTVGKLLKIDSEKIKNALADFRGVKRRFEYIIKTPEKTFIDDYAHHPEEINSFLDAVKSLYPKKKITAVFQPHLFSRTNDLHVEFAAALDKADEIILLPIYPAREQPMTGVNSEMILAKMKNKNSQVLTKEALMAFIETHDPELLLTIGAGDIDALVEQIKNILTKKFHYERRKRADK